jgi:hypothetical protein
VASLVYTPFKEEVMEGLRDLATAGDTIKSLLVMNTTTTDTEEDDKFVGDITTLGENDGSGYTGGFGGAGRQTLAGQDVTQDTANNRGKFDGTDEAWTTLGAGANPLQGDILHIPITSDALSPMIVFVDFPSDVTLNGGDFTIQWHADGIMYLG